MDKIQLDSFVKKIERDLYKANTDLKNSVVSRETIFSIYSSLDELEKFLSDKKTEALFFEKFKETNLLPLLRQLGVQLQDVKKFVESFEEKDARFSVLLEKYRTTRTYYFSNIQTALDFVFQLFSLFSIDFFSFKLNLIGLLNLEELAKTYNIEMESKQSLKVNCDSLKQLIDFMVSKSKWQSFTLDSSDLKIFWKSPSAVSIECANEKLKRIDFLAKSVGGNYSEF